MPAQSVTVTDYVSSAAPSSSVSAGITTGAGVAGGGGGGATALAYLFIHSLRSRNSCVFVCNFLFERILQILKADTKATIAAVVFPHLSPPKQEL